MSLNKAINSGKEYRKQYIGAKAVDCTCRNHGSCAWCRENRLHGTNRRKQAMEERESIMDKIEYCGFDKDDYCTEHCEYFVTCTRNPYFYPKEGKKDGGKG